VLTYGATLERLRTAHGVSKRALARDLGLSSHTLVVRSEAGERPPADADEVLRYAAALGLDPDETDELLTSAGYWPVAFMSLGPGDATLRKLAGALNRLGDEPAEAARVRRAIDAVLDLLPETPAA
jgi:transcriptional regulator with XRE-family HTH domain